MHDTELLEELWDTIEWERKFEYSTPTDNLVAVFGKNDLKAAKRYFATHHEETQRVYRAAHLGMWSSGEKIVVTEEAWD